MEKNYVQEKVKNKEELELMEQETKNRFSDLKKEI